jgi:hypothetical protein
MAPSDKENVFIIYLDQEEDDDSTNDDSTFEPSTAPTLVPPELDADFLECPSLQIINDHYGVSDWSVGNGTNDTVPKLWGVAPVEFVYSIQLNALSDDGDEDLILTEEGERVLMTSLSRAMMYSIYQNECENIDKGDYDGENHFNRDRDLGYHQRRRRQLDDEGRSSTLKQRQLSIQSISLGTGHRLMGSCPKQVENESKLGGPKKNTTNTMVPTNSTAFDYTLPSCGQVSGIVLIGFDTVGEKASSFYTVGTTIIDRIQDDIANGSYLDQVNRYMEAFDVKVSSMEYVNSNYFDKLDQGVFAPLESGDWAQYHQLSTFSKITIPIIVLLFFMMLCFCWCSYSEYAEMLRKRFAVVIYGDGHYDDTDEYSDGTPSHFQPYRKPEVVEALHNVEAQHNKFSFTDVEHCNSPNCNLCHHPSNHRTVSMIGQLSNDFGGGEDATCSETNLQDLTEMQQKGHEEEKDVSPSTTFSTDVDEPLNPFSLPGTQSPSLIRIVAEDEHNNDTSYNDPEIVSFVKVDSILDEPDNQTSIKQRDVLKSRSTPTPTSSWDLFPSLYRRSKGANDNDDMSFVECDPLGLTLVEVDSDDRSDDYLDFMSIPVPRSSTLYTYAPSKGSKREASHTSCPLPSSWMAPFSTTRNDEINWNNTKDDSGGFSSDGEQFGRHDSIILSNDDSVTSYNEDDVAGNKTTKSGRPKIVRQKSLEDSLEEVPPILLGRKRTLTDDDGRVRQEVAL